MNGRALWVPPDPIADEIAAFADRHELARRAAEIDRAGEFPWTEFRAMGSAGLLGLHLPTAVGGRGLPVLRTGIALFHLARTGGTAFAKLAIQPEFSSVLAERGSAALVDRYFRPLIAGTALVGNQITEPGHGSDAGALETVAVPDGEGSYRLSGTKSEVAFAADAAAAIVYARVPSGDRSPGGITAFLVPQDLPGVRRSRDEDLGERWMRRGTVVYEEVRVPADHRLGEEGRGLEYAKGEFARERALLAAIYLGVGRASWEEVVGHVGRRTAFGEPLAHQQGVAFPLVEDGVRLEAAWRYAEHQLRGLDEGTASATDSGLAKWLAVEAALGAIDHAIQFHGGRGYARTLPHERRWRDVRSGRIAHGASELLLDGAARRLWPRRRSEPTPR
ncbi:MAG TPA: acyl-CoA dehydrogenase family protein [Thermoplasmata archaeon]|nr:acyl-CoA dehydrogenase family protein [Thermoplasmata archaeon]